MTSDSDIVPKELLFIMECDCPRLAETGTPVPIIPVLPSPSPAPGKSVSRSKTNSLILQAPLLLPESLPPRKPLQVLPPGEPDAAPGTR